MPRVVKAVLLLAFLVSWELAGLVSGKYSGLFGRSKFSRTRSWSIAECRSR